MKKKVLALLLIFSVVTVLGEAVFPADGVAEKRKRILNYLRSLPEKSEGKLLSGQQCEAWPKIGKTGLNDLSKVYGITGRWPAIGGFDYCEMKGSNTDPALFKPPRWREVNPYIKEWAAKGGLVTISAHMPNPWTGSNAWDRTDCARFADLRRADTPARKAYWRMVRGIADGLEDLQDAKVVVLWRPFHELEGEWFWWGGEGADGERVLILKELWREMHRYMTDRRGLRNLIWVFNGKACHYPGDDVVDLNSADIYGNNVGERISRIMPHIESNDKKPFALAEFGPSWKKGSNVKYDFTGVVDEVLSAAPNCVYFLAWTGPWSLWYNENSDKLMSDSRVVTLDGYKESVK